MKLYNDLISLNSIRMLSNHNIVFQTVIRTMHSLFLVHTIYTKICLLKL